MGERFYTKKMLPVFFVVLLHLLFIQYTLAGISKNSLSKQSHVAEFEGAPELFNVLVSSPTDDWNILTFQEDFDTVLSGPKLEKDLNYFRTNDKNLDEALKERDNIITVNCTVIYLDQCTSWNKCRQSCHSIGASSYRWFHDGCCECVGSTCLNYGANESRCRNCPEPEDLTDDYDEALNEDMQDFDDHLGPFDGFININF